MATKVQFKGGAVFLNCGGSGPDDYLLKPINSGRWVLVKLRWGRNFTGNIEAAKADREAMGNIFPVAHVCVPDNARRLQKMEQRGCVLTMSGAEFWEKYKGCPLVNYRPAG